MTHVLPSSAHTARHRVASLLCGIVALMLIQHPTSVAEAREQQQHLRQRLDLTPAWNTPPNTLVGLDVSYQRSRKHSEVAATAVVLEWETLSVVETATVHGSVSFPYVPGLLAFREAPVLLRTLEKLSSPPELLVCDGFGVAHPQRFGIACHMGVLTDTPAFGVAKTRLIGHAEEPQREKGSHTPLIDHDEVIGRVLRTRTGVKPVFVSVGYQIDLDTATQLTLAMSPRYRIPEATRLADKLSRQALHS